MPTLSPRDKHFTPFRSAAEEAAMRAGEDEWNNEGGHMSSKATSEVAPMNEETIRGGWLGRLVPVALALTVVGAALAFALSSS